MEVESDDEEEEEAPPKGKEKVPAPPPSDKTTPAPPPPRPAPATDMQIHVSACFPFAWISRHKSHLSFESLLDCPTSLENEYQNMFLLTLTMTAVLYFSIDFHSKTCF